MTNFFISYNPYLVECEFQKNGIVLNKKSKFGDRSNKRLQELLGEATNWKGLAYEIDTACSDDDVEITYRGRKIDFEDLEAAIKQYKGTVRFTLKFEETKNEEDVLTQLDKVFAKIKRSKFKEEVFPVNEDGSDIFDYYEEIKDGIFNVSVIATMSSGKTTLINSILHKDLLPSENKACTATIAKILDNDDMDNYEVECYGEDGETVVFERKEASPELLKEYNLNEKVTFINIEGNIPSVSAERIRLCLRDTPGPNNSRNENHGILTNTIIKESNGIVLYVMNATQPFINDDRSLLKDISNEMKRKGKQSRDRFIFVVNKCDDLDEESGETLDKVLSDVTDYLKEFDIIDPIVIPTSARLALLIRKSRNGDELTRKERAELRVIDDYVSTELLHFEKYAVLTPSIYAKLEEKVRAYHENEEDWDLEALVHTGVPAVEETIAEYIDKYAYPIKIKDSVKDIIAVLDELDMVNQFNESIVDDSEKRSRVRNQIKIAEEKLKNSDSIYTEYKEKIDSISLDSFIDEDEKMYATEVALEDITREYNDKQRIDKSVADSLIYSFKKRLNDFQEELEKDLNREIENQIFLVCSQMLEDYSNTIREVLDDIEIEGFDFTKIKSLGKIKIDNVEEICRKHEHSRKEYRGTGNYIKNPERKGFRGFFRFSEPWTIEEKKLVKVGVDIDVTKVIVEVMADYNIEIKRNIKEMFRQANNQVNEYKKAFNENMDTLFNEMYEIVNDLNNKTEDKRGIENRLARTKRRAKWASEIDTEIRELLAI